MREFNKEIKTLGENIEAMVRRISELQKSLLLLKQEVGDLKSENSGLKNKLEFIENSNKMSGVASAIEPDTREEMKHKIRELIREIDGCIAMVKN